MIILKMLMIQKKNLAKKKEKRNLWTVAGTTLKGGQGRYL